MVVNPLLQCTGLVMRFGGVVALKSVDISVGKHEVVGLVGPNGSGKTTFFNVVTGIYKPTAGKVVFEDHDITAKHPLAFRFLAQHLGPQELYGGSKALGR